MPATLTQQPLDALAVVTALDPVTNQPCRRYVPIGTAILTLRPDAPAGTELRNIAVTLDLQPPPSIIQGAITYRLLITPPSVTAELLHPRRATAADHQLPELMFTGFVPGDDPPFDEIPLPIPPASLPSAGTDRIRASPVSARRTRRDPDQDQATGFPF